MTPGHVPEAELERLRANQLTDADKAVLDAADEWEEQMEHWTTKSITNELIVAVRARRKALAQ